MKKHLLLPAITIWMLFISCERDVENFVQFLNEKEQTYEEICHLAGEVAWQRFSGEGTIDKDLPDIRFQSLFENDTLKKYIDYYHRNGHLIKNDTLQRRVELWHRMLTGAQVNLDPEIRSLEHKIIAWVDSKDPDKNRQTNEMERLALELLRLRNEKAHALGFENYAEMTLELSGIQPDWFHHLITTIDSLTLPVYRKNLDSLRKSNQLKSIQSQDVQSLYFKYYMARIGPEIDKANSRALMIKTVEDLGFAWQEDAMHMLEKELPEGLSGEGITIKIPGDFRTVFTPDLSFKNRMHEIGHGLQLQSVKIHYPILKGYDWNLGGDNAGWAEAMADVIARFVENPKWRAKYAKQKPLQQIEVTPAEMAAYLRFQLVTIMFEWHLYQDVQQDLVTLNNKLMRKYLLVEEDGSNAPKLASELFIDYPMFLYAYTMSDIISWQIHQALDTRFGAGYIFDPGTANFLITTLFQDGELYPWEQRLQRATGKKLDMAGYFKAHGF
ncbi:hypothetical protein KC799_22095 [candidate division KSB1 bacterium]|nr:hypothetical protein [candidate division KSB1 bacterium]